jgi:two-component system, NarL family, nitrate/nitrite response regulator NarL
MRILIADDQLLFADMLEAYLGRLDEVTVDKAPSFAAVADRAEQGAKYDMVILEVVTPGMNGLDGLAKARSFFPETPIAIMSADADPQIVSDAFRLGATGFMPKRTMRGQTMLNAIRLMLAGDRYVPSNILPHDEQAARRQHAGDLSARERDVLRRVRDGYSNRRIAEELGIAPVTVALHLRRVFKRISAKNRTEAVRIATERGLLNDR